MNQRHPQSRHTPHGGSEKPTQRNFCIALSLADSLLDGVDTDSDTAAAALDPAIIDARFVGMPQHRGERCTGEHAHAATRVDTRSVRAASDRHICTRGEISTELFAMRTDNNDRHTTHEFEMYRCRATSTRSMEHGP